MLLPTAQSRSLGVRGIASEDELGGLGRIGAGVSGKPGGRQGNGQNCHSHSTERHGCIVAAIEAAHVRPCTAGEDRNGPICM